MGKFEWERPDTPPLPQEDITAEDYGLALLTLEKYSKVSIDRLSTIEDLSETFAGIGEALKATILSS